MGAWRPPRAGVFSGSAWGPSAHERLSRGENWRNPRAEAEMRRAGKRPPATEETRGARKMPALVWAGSGNGRLRAKKRQTPLVRWKARTHGAWRARVGNGPCGARARAQRPPRRRPCAQTAFWMDKILAGAQAASARGSPPRLRLIALIALLEAASARGSPPHGPAKDACLRFAAAPGTARASPHRAKREQNDLFREEHRLV